MTKCISHYDHITSSKVQALYLYLTNLRSVRKQTDYLLKLNIESAHPSVHSFP